MRFLCAVYRVRVGDLFRRTLGDVWVLTTKRPLFLRILNVTVAFWFLGLVAIGYFIMYVGNKEWRSEVNEIED